MKRWKRLLTAVLAAALFMTQPGGVTFAGAVGRGATAAADAVATAAQYMAEAVQNVMIPLQTEPVVRAVQTYSVANDTGTVYTLSYDDSSGTIIGFSVTNTEAFDGNLVIPASINGVTITAIGENAFYYNSYIDKNKIVTVDIPDTVTSIGKNAFSCENLTTVTGAEGVTAINDSAFINCYKLSSIPDFAKLTSLGQEAFSGTALSSVTIPTAITEIPQGAFSYVTELTEVTFDGAVTSIGNNAFSGTGLTSFTVPESVTSIGSGVFSNCAFLASVTLPTTLTTLGNQAFSGCTALEAVSIPGTVQAIPQQAFSGCTALESVTLGDGVQSIGQSAFDGCSELTSINFPSTLTTINGAAFRYCGFTSIEIPSTVTEYTTTSDGYGYTFDHCGSLLTAKVGSPIIPTSMFSSCGSLQEVELENGVTQILRDSFQYCYALEKIIIPETVTNIESPGFYDTETFAIYGYPGSYAQTYANNNGFNFVDITLQTQTRTLTATVQAPEGEAAVSPEDYTIQWFNAGGTTPISTGTTLSGAELDKTYDFEITLSDELAALYEQPARQSIAPADAANITVTLVRKAQTPPLTLTGKAVTENGAALSGVQVSVTDLADTAEPITGETDDGGVFSLTVPAKTLYLTMQLDGYYSKSQPLSLSGTEADSTHDIGTVMMHETMAGRINLTLTAMHASAPNTAPLTETLLSASGLDIDVTRNNESFTDYEVQGTSLVFLPDAAVQSGDAFTITVTDRNGDFSAEPVTITHDGDAVQTAQINLVENGAFVLGSLTGVNSARALVFDAAGAFLQSYTATSGLQSDPMPDGTYTLVVLQNTARLQKVPALSILQSLGLEQGEDYVVQSIAIKKGELTAVGDLTIPELSTDALRFIVPEDTFVTTNVSQVTAGAQFMVTVQYALQDEAISPDMLEIYLPGVQPVGALTVDNTIQTYAYNDDNGVLTVSGFSDKNDAIIRLYCTASTTGLKNISAYLTMDTGAVQALGSVTLEVTNAQMNAPESTSTPTITVSGKASPRSSIEVYEDDVLMGSAAANAVGSWSLTFDLKDTYQYSYHFLHAEISDDDDSEPVMTDEVMVTYDDREYGAELERITMHYIDHNGQGAQQSFDYSDGNTAAQEIAYYYITPGRYPTFTFEVEFSGNNDALADVYVLTRNRSGDPTYVKTTRNGDKWVGTQDYSSMSTVPAEISAVYVFEDTLPIEFSEEQFLDQASELVQLYGQMEDAIAEAPLWTDEGGSFAISDTGYTISDDTVAFTVMQQNESDNQTPAFNYKLEQSEDKRDELTLEDSGYYPINDEQTIYSTFTFDEQTNSFVTEFVDTKKQIRVAETCTLLQSMDVPEAQAELLSRMTAVLARAEGDNSFWDNLFPSDWTWAENLADWADLLTLIPGVGNVASVTKDFIELSREVTSWIKVIKGNEETLLRSADELYMLLELRCPDGSRKLNDSQYNVLKESLDIAKQEITTYTDNCKLYIGAATAIQAGNLLFSALCLNSKVDEWVGQKTDQFVDNLPDCMGVYKEYYELRKYWNDTKKWKIGGFEGGAGDLIEGVVWTGSELAVEHLQFLSQAKQGLEGIQQWVSVAQKKLGIDVLTVNGVNNYIYNEYKKYEDILFEQQKNIRNMLRGTECPDPEPEPEPDPDPGDGIQLNGKDGFSDEYELLFGLNGVFQSPSLRLEPIYDPAGFVYEAVPSNRLEGVTATVYQQGSDAAWNAADYDQINPQVTDSTGMFAWFVPEGNWKVTFTKDGYQDADSRNVPASVDGWLPVPPPQFEVNVGMVSTAAPMVERVIAYNDRIEIAFSQYMNIASVKETISLSRDGQPVAVTVEPLDAEYNLEETVQYATRFAVTPVEGNCTGTITVSTDAKNYAGTAIEAEHVVTLTVPVQRPTGIAVSGQLGVVYSGSTTVTLTLQPGIAGKTLEVESLTPSLLSVAETTVTTGENGTAALTLTGLLPGEGLIRVSEPESGLSETISVPIAMSEDELTDAEKPAPVTATLSGGTQVTSGMTLESGAQITLSTTTPNAEIRYTLNDTCPCKAEALTYEGPITLTEDTVLRAAALLNGVYSDTIRLELTVASGTEEPENPGGAEDEPDSPDPGGSGGNSGGSSSGGGGGSVATDNRPSISTSGEGSTVTAGDGTVTITPDEGYQIGSVTVNGDPVEIPSSGILTGLDADDEVSVIFERIPGETGLPFADVAPASWYHDAVQYVYENGMMNGTDTASFSPDVTITRAMIVTILHRLENEPAAAASGFADVVSGAYYANAIHWAAANGIVNGVSETSFAPNDPITREQLAAILYRYAQFKGYDVTDAADLSAYTDASQISAYATVAMQWANAEGLITGNTATTINPQGNATRAQAATILMRFCQDIAA